MAAEVNVVTYGDMARDRRFSGVPLPPSDWEGWKDRSYQPSYKSKSWADTISHKREVFLDWLSERFGDLGASIERRPGLTIFLAVLATCTAVPGLLALKVENDPLKLWVPTDLEIYDQYKYYRSTFVGDSRSANFILYRSDGGSMFDHQAMVDALEFHLSYTTTMSGPSSLDAAGSKTYQDFCFKKWYPDGPCSDNSFFSIWDNDVDNIPATSQEIMYEINQFNKQFPVTAIFGDLSYGPDGKSITSAQSIRMLYQYNADGLAFWGAYDVFNWEGEVLKKTQAAVEGRETPEKYADEISYSSRLNMKRIVRRSVDDEVTRLVMKDAPLFVGAILAIVGWLALTFGSMNKVESRFLITWVVLLEMGFCMVFGFGWLGYNRLWSTTNTYVLSSLNAMIPFVIAGVSVDDMIVIEDFYNKCEGKEERLRETMKAAGVAITTTSMTTIVAFWASSYITMPGVCSFCLTSFYAFLWDFVLNITLFPALIVLDQRRIDERRHFLFPCIVCEDFEIMDKVMHVHITENLANSKFGASTLDLESVSLPPPPLSTPPTTPSAPSPPSPDSERDSSRTSDRSIDPSFTRRALFQRVVTRRPSQSGASKSSLRGSDRNVLSREASMKSFSRKDFMDLKAAKLANVKAGGDAEDAPEHEEHIVEHFMNNRFAPALTNENTQIFIITFTLFCAAILGYFSWVNERGLALIDIVPDDSYIADYIKADRASFPQPNNLLTNVVRDVDYTNKEQVADMQAYFRYLESLEDSTTAVGGITGHWYSYYSLYLFANGYDRFDDFNDHLHEFLYVNEDGKNFQSDVACVASGDNPCASVEAARYFIWNKTENLTTKQFEFAELVNAKIATYLPNTRSFVYTDEWLYAYTDSQMYRLTIESLALTIFLVFIIMFIFTDNVSAVWITFMVFLIDADLMGLMYLMQVNVSSISFICLIMGVGLSVDYCVHIGHAYTHSFGKTPNARLVE
ncbi:hypothetical protein TeGR_g6051, partial [Tetraparma gracilis]